MPGQNLTKVEASQRAAVVSNVDYQVQLYLDTKAETFRSISKITFAAKPESATFIDLIASKINSVTLNGEQLDWIYEDSRLELKNLAAENELVVDAQCLYMHTGEGLHRFTDPADNLTYCYSQFEVPDARRVFANFEQPNLKATYRFEVTVPSDWIVLSNSRTPAPVAFEHPVTGATDPDFHTFKFEPTARISTYITAIIAGPYYEVRDELTSSDGRTIPLGVYCRQSLVDYLDAEFVLDQTKRGFSFYETQFARPYPFDNYDQIFVPEYNAGAMENAGCVTFRDEYIFRTPPTDAQLQQLSNTILHELAHMWFGDLVTMNWWDDLWLNESFAEFMSYWCMAEGTQFTDSWTGFCIRKVWGVNCDQMPTTHPIVAPINDLADVEVNFDGITYSKGACVLRQLVSYVGIDKFLAALHSYFDKHAWGNAVLQDLLDELEAASERDLGAWTKVWLLEAGITELKAELERDDSGAVKSYRINQLLPQANTSLRPHSLTVGGYDFNEDGRLVLRERFAVEVNADQESTTIPELVGTNYPVYVLNDTDVAYAKIRLDEESWQQVVAHIDAFDDSLPRVVLMCAAWDMVRDGDLAAGDYIDLALKALSNEENSTVLGGIIRHATGALFYYAADPVPIQPKLAKGLFDLAQAAEAGTDKQQQLVRGFLGVAGPQEAETIQGWYEAEAVFEGVHVTNDLKWRMVQALAGCGRAGGDLIDTLLTTDDTITGREEASLARAALPGAANKLKWANEVLNNTQLPNGQLESILAGLGNSLWLNPEEGAGLVKLYFDSLERIWDERTLHMAESIVEGLFPLELAGRGSDLVSECQEWLDQHPEAPRALRRKILEEQDGARRVQRGRQLESR